jgi:hypothetical protein
MVYVSEGNINKIYDNITSCLFHHFLFRPLVGGKDACRLSFGDCVCAFGPTTVRLVPGWHKRLGRRVSDSCIITAGGDRVSADRYKKRRCRRNCTDNKSDEL